MFQEEWEDGNIMGLSRPYPPLHMALWMNVLIVRTFSFSGFRTIFGFNKNGNHRNYRFKMWRTTEVSTVMLFAVCQEASTVMMLLSSHQGFGLNSLICTEECIIIFCGSRGSCMCFSNTGAYVTYNASYQWVEAIYQIICRFSHKILYATFFPHMQNMCNIGGAALYVHYQFTYVSITGTSKLSVASTSVTSEATSLGH